MRSRRAGARLRPGVAGIRSRRPDPTRDRRRPLSAAVAALALVPGAAEAQVRVGVEEAPLTRSASPAVAVLAPLSEVPVLEAPAIAPLIRVAQEQATDGVRREAGEPYRFADPFEVEATPATHGRWETTADGETAVWRLRVASAGSVSLNLGFTRYLMPPGGRLWVYTVRDGESNDVIGPFTDGDNEAHGELWTPALAGAEAVIEVAVPAGGRRDLDLRVGSVNRGFRDLLPEVIVSRRHGNCHVDVACSDADRHRDQARSVGLLQFSGTSSCTGVLLNTASGVPRPFFATAAHCMRGESAGRVVVYWNYESAACGDRGGGSRAHFQTGAWERATHAGSDFALLELDDPPRTEHNVYLAGWRRDGAVPTSAVGIHHPRGHVKSISVENDPLSKDVYSGRQAFKVAAWDMGTTETGSSGSPLFDLDKRVVGVLSGGGAACGRDGSDYYGRLETAWIGGGTQATRLSDWLDPDGTGAATVDGRAWNEPPSPKGSLPDVSMNQNPVGRTVDVSGAFEDSEDDALTYGATSSRTGVVTATALNASVKLAPVGTGSALVRVTASDAAGSNRTATQTFTVMVRNDPPETVGTIAAPELRVGDVTRTLDVSAAFRDPDLDRLTYAARADEPGVVGLTLAIGNLFLAPKKRGDATVTVTATDAGGSNRQAAQTFDVRVEGAGAPPPPGGGGGGPSPPPEPPPPPPEPPPPPTEPLRAAFSVSIGCAGDPCLVATGEALRFHDASAGAVRSRRWEFGDGSGSGSGSPVHAWAAAGFYEVRLTVSDGVEESEASRTFLVEAAEPEGGCEHGETTRCLRNSRYGVAVDWFTAGGESGAGSVVHAGTNDSALFRFFDADNWEVLVKVLDGCPSNGHVWVFAAATTDLGHATRVTDTVTGRVREYRNEPGAPAAAITDATAFPDACEPQQSPVRAAGSR